MKKSKVEYIEKADYMDCWGCNATGKKGKKTCNLCEGTGKYKENCYHLIATMPNGQKIGFVVDSIK